MAGFLITLYFLGHYYQSGSPNPISWILHLLVCKLCEVVLVKGLCKAPLATAYRWVCYIVWLHIVHVRALCTMSCVVTRCLIHTSYIIEILSGFSAAMMTGGLWQQAHYGCCLICSSLLQQGWNHKERDSLQRKHEAEMKFDKLREQNRNRECKMSLWRLLFIWVMGWL